MTNQRSLEGIGFFEWMELVRSLALHPNTKYVGMTLASYADYSTGENARPGINRLALATGRSSRTIMRALGELEEIGLVEQVMRGQSRGRNGGGLASVYRLTLPHDLYTLVEPIDFGKPTAPRVAPTKQSSLNVSLRATNQANEVPTEAVDSVLRNPNEVVALSPNSGTNDVTGSENHLTQLANDLPIELNDVHAMSPHILTTTSTKLDPQKSSNSYLTRSGFEDQDEEVRRQHMLRALEEMMKNA